MAVLFHSLIEIKMNFIIPILLVDVFSQQSISTNCGCIHARERENLNLIFIHYRYCKRAIDFTILHDLH